MLDGVPLRLDPWMKEGQVAIFDGVIYARHYSDVLAQVERELRRADCLAVWPPLPEGWLEGS